METKEQKEIKDLKVNPDLRDHKEKLDQRETLENPVMKEQRVNKETLVMKESMVRIFTQTFMASFKSSIKNNFSCISRLSNQNKKLDLVDFGELYFTRNITRNLPLR